MIEDNVTTFSNNDVTLKLTQTVDSNTLEIQFKNINNASSWGENASQNFYITLKLSGFRFRKCFESDK